MVTTNKNTYFLIKDRNGNKYLCPIEGVGIRRQSGSEMDLDDCVEQDVVERYAGNYEVES